MTPRKGHPVKIIKGGKAVTVANLGEAQRMTGVSRDTIKDRMEHGGATRGWRFLEVGE